MAEMKKLAHFSAPRDQYSPRKSRDRRTSLTARPIIPPPGTKYCREFPDGREVVWAEKIARMRRICLGEIDRRQVVSYVRTNRQFARNLEPKVTPS